jgi:hypothetical protein
MCVAPDKLSGLLAQLDGVTPVSAVIGSVEEGAAGRIEVL